MKTLTVIHNCSVANLKRGLLLLNVLNLKLHMSLVWIQMSVQYHITAGTPLKTMQKLPRKSVYLYILNQTTQILAGSLLILLIRLLRTTKLMGCIVRAGSHSIISHSPISQGFAWPLIMSLLMDSLLIARTPVIQKIIPRSAKCTSTYLSSTQTVLQTHPTLMCRVHAL